MPGAACEKCSTANFINFAYCHKCGEPRASHDKPLEIPEKDIPKRLRNVDVGDLEARLEQLERDAADPAYVKIKCAAFADFCTFCAVVRKKFWSRADDHDVLLWLVLRDKGGVTPVHSSLCDNFGTPRRDCECPQRMAKSSVSSMIGRLQAKFNESGRTGPFVSAFNAGNPCDSPRVKKYLANVGVEQKKAHVGVQQAKVFYMQKLKLVMSCIVTRIAAARAKGDVWQVWSLTQMACFLTVEMFSFKRPKELSETAASEVFLLPPTRSGKGVLLFNCVWGKTLRFQAAHVFSIVGSTIAIIDPVAWVRKHCEAAKACGVDLTVGASGRGFLFRSIDVGARKTRGALQSPKMNQQLVKLMKEENLWENESLRGLRSGGAIEAALMGADISSIMQQAGWSNRGMAQHYLHILEVLMDPGAVPASLYADSYVDTTAQKYRSRDELGDMLRVVKPN